VDEKIINWHRHVCSPSMYYQVTDKLMFNNTYIAYSVQYGEVKNSCNSKKCVLSFSHSSYMFRCHYLVVFRDLTPKFI